MPHARFRALDAEQQAVFLDAAFAEFSAHGLVGSSLNRIIRDAGLSKGSLYYYFDDKQDLYGEVLRVHLDRLLDGHRLEISAEQDAEVFWNAVERHATVMMTRLESSPELLSLFGDALGSAAARRDAEHVASPWWGRVIETGQAAGAVRADLPTDLLVSMAMGMTLAMDTWLLTHTSADTDLAITLPRLMRMLRGALAPDPAEGQPAQRLQ
ncbi:TetR/AcrR family transcriptional regulator [Microbacterium sp. LBN7]|uniref:TetR/AcrR family transcriptional regulator n=1 Tax=Microbacterium sp. LBN7 TaxID=3129773 RepID=UPI00324977DC